MPRGRPRKAESEKKSNSGRRPLTLLRNVLVLGGRYMISRGSTTTGLPLMYISVPGKPGLTILAQNLREFQRMFNEAVEEFGPEVDAPGSLQPYKPAESNVESSEDTVKEPAFNVETAVQELGEPCPGAQDTLYQKYMTVCNDNWSITEHEYTHSPHVSNDHQDCKVCGYNVEEAREPEVRARWTLDCLGHFNTGEGNE